MDCQEIRTLLDPFADGELGPLEERKIRDHLNRCSDCRSRARELSSLARGLAGLPRLEPRGDLAGRTLAAVRRRAVASHPLPSWWSGFLAAGAAVALAVCLWVAGEVVASFRQAGGGEFLGLIGSYPHLLWRYPGDTALALLEALPMASVALSLASALIAGLLGVQLLATAAPFGHGRSRG